MALICVEYRLRTLNVVLDTLKPHPHTSLRKRLEELKAILPAARCDGLTEKARAVRSLVRHVFERGGKL